MALDVRGLTPLLQVYDMPTSVRFYRDALGFEVVSTSPLLSEDRFHWALFDQFVLRTTVDPTSVADPAQQMVRNVMKTAPVTKTQHFGGS